MVHVAAWHAAYSGLMPDALLDQLSVRDRAVRWRTILAATGADRRNREWVIERGGAVVCFSSTGQSRDPDASLGTAEIYALNLVPTAWGMGLGRLLVYELLFRTTAQTLLDLGLDKKRLGAQLGITAVLHTWSRDLSYHPHLHCIVTGSRHQPRGDTTSLLSATSVIRCYFRDTALPTTNSGLPLPAQAGR